MHLSKSHVLIRRADPLGRNDAQTSFGLLRAMRGDPELREIPIILVSARAGPTGVGKTHLAIALCGESLKINTGSDKSSCA